MYKILYGFISCLVLFNFQISYYMFQIFLLTVHMKHIENWVGRQVSSPKEIHLAFSVVAPSVWNIITAEIRLAPTITVFCKTQKIWFANKNPVKDGALQVACLVVVTRRGGWLLFFFIVCVLGFYFCKQPRVTERE